MAAAVTLLSACGGGDQVKEFEPTAFVSFGDENSAFTEVTVGGSGTQTTVKGMKYGVNSLLLGVEVDLLLSTDTLDATQTWVDYPLLTTPGIEVPNSLKVDINDGYQQVERQFNLDTNYTPAGGTSQTASFPVTYTYSYDCANLRLWVQILASSYGLGFQNQCPSDRYSGAVSYAANGATVADTAAQVAAHRGELGKGSIVTVMAGQNDILDAYARIKSGSISLNDARTQMTARGGDLAAVINDVARTGARVVVIKLHDLGLSPLARSEGAMSQLSALTLAFNNGILNKITNDGRKIALVPIFDYSSYIREANEDNRSYDNIENISTPTCRTSSINRADGTVVSGSPSAPFYGGEHLLYCSNLTLNSGVSLGSYFWADNTHLAPGGHVFLAARAYEIVDKNPF